MTFDEFKIHEQLLEAISYMNFAKVSPIQEQAIPIALTGKDILACAQTGTGKTASFVIPILDDLVRNGSKGTTTLIIVPTRELAIQIDQEIQGFSYFTDTSSKSVYGGDKGTDWDAQKKALTNGTNIIIATPGRLMQHLSLGYAKLDSIRHLIIDEADRMLDMGFIDDIKQILSYIPAKRQNLMFSATMAPNIRKLANKILSDPQEITISIAKPAAGVTQSAYMAYTNQKIDVIQHVLEKNPNYDSILIFSSTKRNVHQIVQKLSRKHKGQVEAISSDFEQKEREEVLLRFKAKQTRILVATDVLSRGIDIREINLVINFDVPGDAADYVHRIGRTARADKKGEAITLINDEDIYKFHRIEKLIERPIDKLPIPAELGEAPKWSESGNIQVKNGKKPFVKNSKKPFKQNGENSKQGEKPKAKKKWNPKSKNKNFKNKTPQNKPKDTKPKE